MEGGSSGAAPAGLTCQRHGQPTRITCVTCDSPICPACAVRTQVGLKCPDHASRPEAPRRPRFQALIGLVILAALAGFIQLVRTTGRGEPATPPCPTETAPDVGIGSEGGTHWTDLSTSGVCGRYDAGVVWTGTQMIVWGGENCAGAACPTIRAPHLADGTAYTPQADAWRKLPKSPLAARAPATSVWTGTEMVVWGGVAAEAFFADGAAYDPARDRWRAVASSPLSPRNGVMSVWTGSELLVWGGGDAATNFSDGAAYQPATDQWRPIGGGPLAGRSGGVAAWTGREMVVWGGVDLIGAREFADGAAFDPASNRWRTIAASPLPGSDDPATVWTGRELLVWGGNTVDGGFFDDGAAYDPAADRWRALAPAPLTPRTAPGTVWTGREMVIWGGIGLPGDTDAGPLDQIIQRRTLLNPLDDGAAYDPVADRWRPLEPVPLLGRGFPMAIWDGEGMLMWGGLVVVSSPASSSEGVRYRP